METGTSPGSNPEERSKILGSHMLPDFGDEPLIPPREVSLAQLPGVLDEYLNGECPKETHCTLYVRLQGERDWEVFQELMHGVDLRLVQAFQTSFPMLTWPTSTKGQSFILKVYYKSWQENPQRGAILSSLGLFTEKEVPIRIGVEPFSQEYENGQRVERAVARRNLNCLTALQAKRASGQSLAPDEEDALVRDRMLRIGVDSNILRERGIPDPVRYQYGGNSVY